MVDKLPPEVSQIMGPKPLMFGKSISATVLRLLLILVSSWIRLQCALDKHDWTGETQRQTQ